MKQTEADEIARLESEIARLDIAEEALAGLAGVAGLVGHERTGDAAAEAGRE